MWSRRDHELCLQMFYFQFVTKVGKIVFTALFAIILCLNELVSFSCCWSKVMKLFWMDCYLLVVFVWFEFEVFMLEPLIPMQMATMFQPVLNWIVSRWKLCCRKLAIFWMVRCFLLENDRLNWGRPAALFQMQPFDYIFACFFHFFVWLEQFWCFLWF